MNYFENAGRKMGNIINIAFKILIIVCALAAVAVFIAAMCVLGNGGGFGLFFLVLVGGVLAEGIILGLGYLMFLQLAAFAELVENSNLILQEIKKEESLNKTPTIRTEKQLRTDTVQAVEEVRKAVICPECGKSQFEGRTKCFACGAPMKTQE